MKYQLIIFDAQHREIKRSEPTEDRYTLERRADAQRPVGGASYIVEAGKELKFKKYRLGQPSLRPRPVSTRRPSERQILAAARREAEEGNFANAAYLLDLVSS